MLGQYYTYTAVPPQMYLQNKMAAMMNIMMAMTVLMNLTMNFGISSDNCDIILILLIKTLKNMFRFVLYGNGQISGGIGPLLFVDRLVIFLKLFLPEEHVLPVVSTY